ncbi:MAG: nitroreductase family protein [Acidimicrobiales bacterium]
MELADAVRRRRMVRSFEPEPLPPDVLRTLLTLALGAPSAGNLGGWEAVVLEGPEQTAAFWDATTTEDWRRRSRRWDALRHAPVVVVLFADPDAYPARYREPDKAASGLGEGVAAWPIPYWHVDAGFAALLLLLGAVDAGLGACFLGNFRGEDRLADVLGVPAGRRYVGAVLLGRPGDDDPPSTSASRPRRTVDEVFHRGKW